MAVELTVPPLGESITEAVVGKWHKKVGEAVTVDEPVVVLETDKVTVDVPAPAAGALASIAYKEGDKVKVGDVLGTIEPGAAGATAEPPPQRAAPPLAAPAAVRAAAAPAAATRASRPCAAQASSRRTASTPAQLRAAAPAGASQGGRARPARPRAPRPPPARPRSAAPSGPRPDAAREERVKMTPLRKRVAERLLQAQTNAAILTTFNEVDMGAVMELRKQYKEKFQKKHGVKLGLHELLRARRRRGAQGLPAGQRGDRRRGRRLQALLRHRRGGVRHAAGWWCRWCATRTRCRMAELEKTIADSARARATTSSRWRSCRAAPSPSPTAASSARCCPRRSSTRRRPASSGMHNIVERPVVRDGQVVIRPDDVPGALATTTG